MPNGPRIGPRVADEQAYARALRRSVLQPYVKQVRARVDDARRDYVAIRDDIAAMRRDIPNLAAISQEEAQIALTRGMAYHRARFTKSMRRFFGVRVDLVTDTPIDLPARIRENVDLIKTIPERYHDGLVARLQLLAEEAPFDQNRLMKALRSEYQSSGYNLRRLTRDQTNKLIGQLNEVRQTELGVERYVWATSGDDRVRPSHADNDGTEFAWSNPPATGHPGEEIQCFPGSVLVHPAGLEASVAYRYVGELIEMHLADGIEVTATPNHPILTETGWKRAGDLDVGDKLLERRFAQHLSTGDLNPDLGDRYLSAEKLHRFLGGSKDPCRASRRTVDLHGHPALRDEEIEVVSAPRELRDHFEALGDQVFNHLRLIPTDVSSGSLTGDGGLVPDLRLAAGIAGLHVGGSSEAAAILRRESHHADEVRFSSASWREAEIVQAGPDHLAANPEFGLHLFHRLLAMPARLDGSVVGKPPFVVSRVAAIRRISHAGPVYSFQTNTGIILANGIVTHNCRCVAIAIIPSARVRAAPPADLG